MSNGLQLEEIKCPFYIKTVNGVSGQFIRNIHCEGFMKGAKSIVAFPHIDDYFRFKIKFCESVENCVYCPYYLIAEMKYEV